MSLGQHLYDRWVGTPEKPGFFWIVMTIILLTVGTIYMNYKDGKYDYTAYKGAKRNQFDLIVIAEKNDWHKKELLAACEGYFDESQPVLEFYHGVPGMIGKEQWFAVKNFNNPQFVTPKFIRKFEGNGDDAPEYTPCYAVFRSPDAKQKLQEWLRKYDYTDSKVELKIWNDDPHVTYKVTPEHGPSELMLNMYYHAGGHLHLWDGHYLTRLGEVYKKREVDEHTDARYKEYIGLVQKIAQ